MNLEIIIRCDPYLIHRKTTFLKCLGYRRISIQAIDDKVILIFRRIISDASPTAYNTM
jgi:hypothetical protein